MEIEVNKKLPVVKGRLRLNLSDAFDIVSSIKVHANGILKKKEKYYIFCGMSLFESGYYKPDEDIKWEFNTAKLRDVFVILDNIEGVQTVKDLSFSNKVGTALGYSQYAYDTVGATVSGVIYPSIDPMIFEVKDLNTDIQGRVVTL